MEKKMSTPWQELYFLSFDSLANLSKYAKVFPNVLLGGLRD